MGVINSTTSSANIIMYDIKNTIRELMNNYSVWADDNVCKNLEMIYKNKLIKLTNDQLAKIILSIGYKFDKPINKDKMCSVIIQHYKRRIHLLKYIDENMDICSDMITKAKHGNVCKNANKYIGDFFTCNTIPKAFWIDADEYKKVINKLRSSGKLGSMSGWVKDLENHYYKSLKSLLKVVNLIKRDIDDPVSTYDFDAIELYTKQIVENMKMFCETYYLLAINSF